MRQEPASRVFLVVLAGGRSTRASQGDSTAPKQFREVGGAPVFVHGLRELAQVPELVHAVVVVPDAWRPVAHDALAAADLPVAWTLATAGEHRTASTWSALRALAALPAAARPAPDDLVAVHDAARPFASRHLLMRVAEAAQRHAAAVPAVPVPDTVVQLLPGQDEDAAERPLAGYLERSLLAAVQTPQAARWADLHAVHAWAAAGAVSFTDDGGLLAARGVPPVVVPGEPGNWKITTEDDWRRAAERLRRRSAV
ncbi:MAG: 2-C-methyl-D-erythritol 4-phosphate cytidylyltransferase [Candidatus Krumholzibacteriia bacterium]